MCDYGILTTALVGIPFSNREVRDMNTTWESIKEEIEQLYHYVDRNSFNLIVLQTMIRQLGISVENFIKELTERNEQNEIH